MALPFQLCLDDTCEQDTSGYEHVDALSNLKQLQHTFAKATLIKGYRIQNFYVLQNIQLKRQAN